MSNLKLIKKVPCTLEDCPIGLFIFKDGELCLKTEYGLESYIVSSGERFWGGAKTKNQLCKIMVIPCKIEHFDNQPLKFEELKPGMWCWDNKIKEYIKLEKHHAKGLGYLGYDLKINDLDWIDLEFEENRFYLRELKEND